MKHVLLVCWGYVVELMLAAVIYALLLALLGRAKLATFLLGSWVAWSTVCGVVFAAAIAMFILVLQMLTSEFGGYLASRSSDGTFRKAFGFAIAFSFSGMVVFVIAGVTALPWVAHAAGIILLLVTINVYTMVKNAVNLQRMHALFERIRRRTVQQDAQDTSNGGTG